MLPHVLRPNFLKGNHCSRQCSIAEHPHCPARSPLHHTCPRPVRPLGSIPVRRPRANCPYYVCGNTQFVLLRPEALASHRRNTHQPCPGKLGAWPALACGHYDANPAGASHWVTPAAAL